MATVGDYRTQMLTCAPPTSHAGTIPRTEMKKQMAADADVEVSLAKKVERALPKRVGLPQASGIRVITFASQSREILNAHRP